MLLRGLAAEVVGRGGRLLLLLLLLLVCEGTDMCRLATVQSQHSSSTHLEVKSLGRDSPDSP